MLSDYTEAILAEMLASLLAARLKQNPDSHKYWVNKQVGYSFNTREPRTALIDCMSASKWPEFSFDSCKEILKCSLELQILTHRSCEQVHRATTQSEEDSQFQTNEGLNLLWWLFITGL